MQIRFPPLVFVVLWLAGCATMSNEQRAELEISASRSITCQGKDDCEVKWSRAVQWVRENSAYRFDQATEYVISTKGPLPNDVRPAYTITRVAKGDGSFEFDFGGGCDNMFGCRPSMLEAKASFSDYVMGPADAAAAPEMKAPPPVCTPTTEPLVKSGLTADQVKAQMGEPCSKTALTLNGVQKEVWKYCTREGHDPANQNSCGCSDFPAQIIVMNAAVETSSFQSCVQQAPTAAAPSSFSL